MALKLWSFGFWDFGIFIGFSLDFPSFAVKRRRRRQEAERRGEEGRRGEGDDRRGERREERGERREERGRTIQSYVGIMQLQ